MSKDAQVRAIVHDASRAAAAYPDPLATLSKFLALAIEGDADPYLLTDLLAEAIAATIAVRVPDELQHQTSTLAARALLDHLRAYGTI